MFKESIKNTRNAIREVFGDKNLEAICVWQVLVPFAFLVILAPIYFLFFPQVDHPIQRTFAHGDLLIFSGLVLISAAIELKRAELKYAEILRGLATFLIFLYGFMKVGAMLRERDLADAVMKVQAANTLFGFSAFNLSVAIGSMATSFYAFLQTVRKENAQRVKDLVPEHPRK